MLSDKPCRPHLPCLPSPASHTYRRPPPDVFRVAARIEALEWGALPPRATTEILRALAIAAAAGEMGVNKEGGRKGGAASLGRAASAAAFSHDRDPPRPGHPSTQQVRGQQQVWGVGEM